MKITSRIHNAFVYDRMPSERHTFNAADVKKRWQDFPHQDEEEDSEKNLPLDKWVQSCLDWGRTSESIYFRNVVIICKYTEDIGDHVRQNLKISRINNKFYGGGISIPLINYNTNQPISDLEAEFNSLANQWYKETRMLSFIRQKATHICYQNIIGMGKEALPFIFKELSKGKGDWIYAIERITRVNENNNPVSKTASFKEAIALWLQWAKDNNYFHE